MPTSLHKWASLKVVTKSQTIQRVATPTAILVGLEEPVVTTCTDALADGGLRVLRVGHVAAAGERIPITMPQLVVVPTTMRPEDAEMLADRCVAVGAEILRIAPNSDPGVLHKLLKDAANVALIKSLRRGG